MVISSVHWMKGFSNNDALGRMCLGFLPLGFHIASRLGGAAFPLLPFFLYHHCCSHLFLSLLSHYFLMGFCFVLRFSHLHLPFPLFPLLYFFYRSGCFLFVLYYLLSSFPFFPSSFSQSVSLVYVPCYVCMSVVVYLDVFQSQK